jgi:hypothetical protein
MNYPTLKIGETYFVDNPNAKSFVGRLVAVIDPFTVALEDASWVANTGRFHLFMKGQTDNNTEFEPCGRVAATRWQSIHHWPHALPKEPK